MERYSVYVEKRPVIRIEAGMLHVEFRSGAVSFEFVMSPHIARHGVRDATKALALWESTHGDVLPFPSNDGGEDDQAATP